MQVNDKNLIAERPELAQAVSEASHLLEQVLGASAQMIKADWSLTCDERGRPLIDLRISDWTGSVGYRFTEEELIHRQHMRVRLHRLWGDLLMVQSHVQLDHMNWQLEAQEGN